MSRGKRDFLVHSRDEEDSAEETLLRDPLDLCDQRPTRQAVSTPETQDTQKQRSDLADIFNLFKSYLDNKVQSHKEETSCSGNDLEILTKSICEVLNIQFNLNAELLKTGKLVKARKLI